MKQTKGKTSVKDNKMLKTAGFMVMVTLLAKFCGLVRDSTIAAFFSTGIEADAFMTASKLPTTLFDVVIGGVISASFIPVFNFTKEKQGAENAKKFADKFITLILLASCIIAAAGILFSNQLVHFMAPHYSDAKLALSVQLTSIMFPMIIFTGMAFSFVGVLQSYGEYRIPSLISLVSNIAIIGYFFLFGKRFGVYGLSVTMVFAWALQVIVQIPSLVKFRFLPKPNFKFFDKNIKSAMLLAGPMLISTWVQPLYSIINSRIASGIDGAVSTLEYANRLYIIVTGTFSFVVTNLIFPKLAQANARGDEAEAKTLMVTSIKAICFVILPVMILFVILSKPITAIIYERINFTAENTIAVGAALGCYSTGMIGLAVNEVLSKIYFSKQNSKTPMVNSVISMFFNIALAYLLFKYLKTPGLALAAAGGSMFNALLNALCLRKSMPQLMTRSDWSDIAKTVICAAAMSVTVMLVYKATAGFIGGTFIANAALCAVCAVPGLLIYAALALILKVQLIANLLKKQEV